MAILLNLVKSGSLRAIATWCAQQCDKSGMGIKLLNMLFTYSIEIKVGLAPIEFAMAGVRHSAIVNPACQLVLTRRVNNS